MRSCARGTNTQGSRTSLTALHQRVNTLLAISTLGSAGPREFKQNQAGSAIFFPLFTILGAVAAFLPEIPLDLSF
jgi:hypothetical protein